MMRTQNLTLIGVTALLGLGLSSDAQTTATSTAPTSSAACCQLTTSLVQDALRGDDLVSDERFFSAEPVPPNVHFLLDNSGSMLDLPLDDTGNSPSTAAGCNSTVFDALLQAKYPTMTGFETDSYPATDPTFPGLFEQDKIYRYKPAATGSMPDPDWNSDSGTPLTSNRYYGSGGSTVAYSTTKLDRVTFTSTNDNLCVALHPYPSGATATTKTTYDGYRDACKQCLLQKGYYFKSNDKANRFFSGKFLNFYPPKFVVARNALKSIFNQLDDDRVRVGFSTFNSGFGPPVNAGGYFRQGQSPQCSNILTAGASFAPANYITSLNSVAFNTGTPLAKALLNVGQYFSANDDVYTNIFGGSNPYSKYLNSTFTNPGGTNENRSWCWNCQKSSVIIITDGEPTYDALDSTVTSKLTTTSCTNCDTNISDANNRRLDDVARFLHSRDLLPADATVQSLDIYGVGFGLNIPILRNATETWGGGKYVQADDAETLEATLLNFIGSIRKRSTSFSAANAGTLQVDKATGSLLPRFTPGANDAQWKGYLYRFGFASESALGCDPALAATRTATAGSGDPEDYNQDKDCDDLFLVDSNDAPVVENNAGEFVLRAADGSATTTPAVPFWEAGSVLKARATPAWQTRKIWTIVDNGGPGGDTVPDGKIDRYDTPIEFIESNAATLREYMGIGNNTSACSEIASLQGLGSTMDPVECARALIRYYRGADEFHSDPDLRGLDREFLLNDIFHSAPIAVEPPSPKAFCAFSTQCVETLYQTATPLARYPPSTAPNVDAYEQFVTDSGGRDRIVLVGSNGGMLHAFHNGAKTGVDSTTRLPVYDEGTGEELWAFIPPDMLPKLKGNIRKHGYFVDGSPMVRDVWLDGQGTGSPTADGVKQKSEFRTLVVMGSGAGGVHRFALDLTELLPSSGAASSRPPNAKGDFMWMWPQPCDPLAREVGEAFSNYSPKPAPIGAVAMEDSTGPLTVGGIKAKEQWIAFFNGGYDRYLNRGRGLAMVDMTTGETLWSLFNGDTAATARGASDMKFPFAAGVSLLDIGNNSSSAQDSDYLFDTAIVPDYGGQVWTVRFWVPGRLDAGKVNNWFAARSFEVQKALAPALRQNFTQIASNTIQPETGYLRTFLGTGDRYNLTDVSGSSCRLSNPYACALQGCQGNVNVEIKHEGTTVYSATTEFSGGELGTQSRTVSAPATTCGDVQSKVSWDINPSTATGCTVNLEGSLAYRCNGTSDWKCREGTDNWSVQNINRATPPTLTRRYYGFWSYGVSASRTFNTQAEADAYDSTRLTDTNLTNVTGVTANRDGITSTTATNGTPATTFGSGWYYEYSGSERTGSASAIIDGCVIWNSFEPSTSSETVCNTNNNTARLYQSSFVTGAPNCLSSFLDNSTVPVYKRYDARSVPAVPGDPIDQRLIINGKGTTSVVLLEAGGTRSSTVSQGNDLVQSVYQIEVGLDEHDCRHAGASGACK